MNCPICLKHPSVLDHTGEAIMELGGLLVTHFPKLATEPSVRGHLLIEPRRHILDLSEMNEAEARALGVVVQTSVQAMRKVLDPEHVYFFRINDKVPHLHFHLIPRYPGTPAEYWGTKIMQWPDSPKVELDEIKEISRQLRLAIRN